MPSDEDFMSLMEPTQLYNILNESFQYPCLSDPNFLLLLGMYYIFDINQCVTSGWLNGRLS